MIKFVLGFVIALILAGNSNIENFFTFKNMFKTSKQVVKFTKDTTKSIVDSTKDIK